MGCYGVLLGDVCSTWYLACNLAICTHRRTFSTKQGGLGELLQETQVVDREELLHYLSLCFFIDSKTFYICPCSMWMYALHDCCG